MTLRDSSLRGDKSFGVTSSHSKRKTDRGLLQRIRKQRRRKDRRLLSESLEQRQLLAGPDLIGIQPNEGSLLREGSVLNVSPRELVFQFDDATEIDPSTLESGIRITRAGEDGVFESASATSDLGTSGQVLIEFRARASGGLGNGIELQFTSTNRNNGSLPVVTFTDNTINIDVNSNPLQATTAGDLISVLNRNQLPDEPGVISEPSDLIEAIQVSGSSQGDIGTQVPNGLQLTLLGANAAEAATDFGTNGAVRVRVVSQLPGIDGLGTRLEISRQNFGAVANPVVVVSDQTVRVQLNSAPGAESTVADFINAINNNPEASRLMLVALQEGDANFRIGVDNTPLVPLTLSGVTDVLVEPGFVGLGDSSREVVFRFAEPLPDDRYQIDIVGSGVSALRNLDGELFQDGEDLSQTFEINLGPKVVAVVPEPIRRRFDGTLVPEIGTIEVHFNDDDLNVGLAENPAFYQLIFTGDTVSNTDDVVVSLLPPPAVSDPNDRTVYLGTTAREPVEYDNVTNIATLNFGQPLARIPNQNAAGQPLQPGGGIFLTGAARLRVGASDDLPAPPTEVSLVLSPTNVVEPGNKFTADGAGDENVPFDLNSQWSISTSQSTSARLTGEIFNESPFELDLPGPDLPGTRDIRPDDPSRLLRTVPLDYLRNGADIVDGISVIQYNFASSWLGDDPGSPGIREDQTYFNIISEQQKERVREVMQLYSEYLGISFVEVEGEPTSEAFISIAVGDLYGADVRAVSGDGGLAVATRDRNGDGIADLGVLDFQDFDESTDDQFGGEFFRGSMFVVGQLLGFGYADDLPQPVTQSTDFIFAPGTDNEPAFPALADIVHGQYLYRPDSTDIDLYRFTLGTRGRLSVETLAERLSDPSLLDTTLRLYRADGESFTEIARNDDYFSNDSLIELDLDAGTYIIGVSAHGNDSYDPNIEDSGFGGLSEGHYELILDFKPSGANAILDATGVALDGDGDNRPGGVFDFWFVPNDSSNTLYVDKAAPGGTGPLGTIGNPYREIDQAIAQADPGETIRIVGNGGVDSRVETPGDNFAYKVGFGSNGLPLEDGSTLDLPQGVRMIIDSGAILKMSGSRVGVGSVAPALDQSDAALQVLGTPTIITSSGRPARDATNGIIPGSVFFTSINDTELGMGNSSSTGVSVRPGDWGGIDFRGDLDSADESRRNRELEGAFLNHIQMADIRYGGGSVSIGGRQVVVSPIDMAVTRPTIINSRISNSADAAIAATPDTFAETRFTEPAFQAAGTFTPDTRRVGPEISGNTIIDNSINGLFVRVVTRTGDVLETISTAARFDDTDIPHILAENLVIEGTAGGPIIQSSAPSSLLVRLLPTVGGSVPAGSYVYRLTNVNSSGLESAASVPTVEVELAATGAIQLSQLPTLDGSSDFVSRRLYRALVDPNTGLPGEFLLVGQLNASDTSFTDRLAAGTSPLDLNDNVLRSRLDGSLTIDPGTVLKIDGARIEARFGANLLAEGTPSQPIVFTSLEDQRYGGGGTFDTNARGDFGEINAGDWGGIYVGHGSSASIADAVIAGAGGTTRIEGDFASFNAIEVHQGSLRLVDSRLELNADGRGNPADDRVGRGDNAAGTLFVRAATPVVAGNTFVDGSAAAISIDINSLSSEEVNDQGRSRGRIDRLDVVGNAGPLIEGNVLGNNAINGMQVRGGQLATAGVWDDVDIVHVVTDSIEVPNQHIFGGLRLQSDARGSLVVKFESAEDETAGIVVGGSLLTAEEQFRDITDRIGGSLQVVGHPDFPVVLTTLADDTEGAGFDLSGLPQRDTNNNGILAVDLDEDPTTGFPRLPTGPEVNNGLLIDNDVDVNTVGSFAATVANGNDFNFGADSVTVQDAQTGQTLINQNYIFAYTTYVNSSAGVVNLAATTITQPAALIADDTVESRGNFAGPNGTVNWIATSFFLDGVANLFTRVEFDAGTGTLGDIRVVSYLDEDVGAVSDDILVTSGTPGAADFRAFTLDGPTRVGYSHGGYYIEDGTNLVNATYEGWAADEFNDLQTAIVAGNQAFSLPGVIDLVDLPQSPDPDFGFQFGPADVTTAFAWSTNATSSTATVTSFLELLASDPAQAPPVQSFSSGLWNGIVVREAASDRNVSAIAEQEPVRSGFVDTNRIPGQSQFLGEIAPTQQAGDENRRLGFVIDGAVTQTSDVDVYSFIGQSNTEVWLDIDRTGTQLDSVVELIDANGNVLASSNDSLLAETDGSAIFSAPQINSDAAQALSVVDERIDSQSLRVSENIVDATGGSIELSIPGETPIFVSVDAFLTDPAEAVENALETAYGAELGDVTASLNRRTARQFDPDNPAVITRFGDDFVIQLRFDEDFFIGRTVPPVTIRTVGVLGPFIVTADSTQELLGSQVQDAYSSNPKDAGMRIRLPGEAGTRNLYHVRVRSSNTNDPLDFATLNDPSLLSAGRSTGSYQLQIRLSELDEHAGTQLRQADVRYAATGLQIIGQPLHSPLLGEEQEIPGDDNDPNTNDPNDSLQEAQRLGYLGAGNDVTQGQAGPLSSDRLAKSFAGTLASATDVDWYEFTVSYENLTQDAASLFLSTVFDLDYASGFARPDMALYVFNGQGQLVLVGGDSNIADDLPGLASSNNTEDLSRGSAGSEDPYIGAAELIEGTYYVAVSNQQQVPLPLDQFFNPNSANPLLRLEPIDSVRRIAEDRIGQFGFAGGTATAPVVPVLFDNDSIVDYTLDDVLMYVNTTQGLFLVNSFTGENYGRVGDFTDDIREVAFTNNGELFSYNIPTGARTDADALYYRIDTGTGTLSAPIGAGANISTFESTVTVTANAPDVYNPVAADSGVDIQAIDIGALGGSERGFLVANRAALSPIAVTAGADYDENILYRFDPQTGEADGPTVNFQSGFAGQALSGAGTSPREVGRITDGVRNVGAGVNSTVLGVTAPIEIDSSGDPFASLVDGNRFTLSDGNASLTYEFDLGITLTANNSLALDGQSLIIDGNTFELNTGERLQLAPDSDVNLIPGSTVRIEGFNNEVFTFEFVTTNLPSGSNIPVSTLTPGGTQLPSFVIASNLANEINARMVGLGAQANGQGVFFTGPVRPDVSEVGQGVTILGDNGVRNGSIEVSIPETASNEVLINALTDAIRVTGITVDSEGPILTLPNSIDVTFDATAAGLLTLPQPVTLGISGNNGVPDGLIPIPVLPSDSSRDIAVRIAGLVNDPNISGSLVDVQATALNRSVQFAAVTVTDVISPTNGIRRGGLQLGGNVTGIAAVDELNSLFAITSNGALFRINEGTALTNGVRPTIGQPIFTATDLIDVNFTALRSGPVSFDNGELRTTLFGLTSNGEIYAFNQFGELQPVFSGGRSIIRIGQAGGGSIFNASGFDFSTLAFNLWHVTDARETDPGHGIDPLFNNTRTAQDANFSLAFTYEASAFNGQFPAGEQPVLVTNNTVANPRQDGTPVEAAYNFPGGAKGVVESNDFSLEGYSDDDQPMLYFNYFLETDGVDSTDDDADVFREDQDSLRVYVIDSNGVQHLVASNSTARDDFAFDDEFDDPPRIGQYDDDIDVDVQQLFDNTGTWRQARVPLGEFAGDANISLRIEFSTAGTIDTGSGSIGTVAGSSLLDGQRFVVDGETFAVDLAPAINTPSGSQLAALYADPNAVATFTVDTQTYFLDDGARQPQPGLVAVPLADLITSAGSLEAVSAVELANAVATTVLNSPPPNTVVSGLSFNEPQDLDPNAAGNRTDTISGALPLPYTGGNFTFIGEGQLGNDRNAGSFAGLEPFVINPVNQDDVDLIRVNLEEGSLVDVQLADTAADELFIQASVRFFDQSGNPINPLSSGINQGSFVAPETGTFYIGLSGNPNTDYDARFDDTGSAGSIGGYEATIAINTSTQDLRVQTSGSTVELTGTLNVDASPDGLFSITGDAPLAGIPVSLSRFMTSEEVAAEVREVLADRFTGGDESLLPLTGSSIRIPGFTINDPGPFVDESERYGDRFGAGPLGGTRDNGNEGVFLDDFIIGFAERGEIATSSNVVDSPFVTDLRRLTPEPDDPVSNLVTGAYQVEIRSASEYVQSVNVPRGFISEGRFRTFDTNTRLTDSRAIEALPANLLRDGSSFSLFDGRNTVEFEFDQLETNNGVTPGRVQIPFTLLAVEPGSEDIDPDTNLPIPGTGTLRPQTAPEVARAIVDAINRSDVQSVIDVPALLNSGLDDNTSPIINLFGEVVVNNDDDALAAVIRGDLSGDENRDREVQGVILVENSRFLFNEDYGIQIDHGLTATVDGQDTNSIVRYPRNLVELNSESIKPGVVVQSNVLAFNGAGGIQIEGIPTGTTETQSDPIGFDRIINNTIVGGTITAGVESPPETVQGILFPQGNISFADAVASYTPDAGGSAPLPIFQTATQALGEPEIVGRGAEPTDGLSTVSLGLGGSIVLQFTDNLLTGSGDSRPDLVVFETGAVEGVLVEISRDGQLFEQVGTIAGLSNQIDIDSSGFSTQDRFAFVRLTDLRSGDLVGGPLGADIDAVGAISSVPTESFSPGGVGIEVIGNAAPALLNNVIANSEVGVDVDANLTLPILGGNTYFRNTDNVPTNVSVGEFAQELSDAEVIFVSAADLVFAPSAGAKIIDSSIDSLEDRASLTAVKNPLGLPPSPILAPSLDVNGQLRVDDPNVETPSGLGERVFKDRGASDRGDLVGPRVVLQTPQGAPNLGIQAGTVSVLGAVPEFFEIQLIDGLSPADVVPGTGIDDRSVSNGSILLLQDNVALVEGVDYRFGYNPSTNVIRLTPIAGVWQENSTYVIRMIDASDAIVQGAEGDTYVDGTILNVRDLQGEITRFEYETGISLTITDGTLVNDPDGITFEVFDGNTTVTFELDNDGVFAPLNTRVVVPETGEDASIADALAAAVNASALNLTAITSGTTIQFVGSNPLATVTSNQAFVTSGAIGSSIGFGLQIPADGNAIADTVAEGQTFTIRLGNLREVVFELDSDNQLENPNAVAVQFNGNSTLDSLANELVRVIGGAGLGLSPANEGFGRVSLGGDANYSLDVTDSGFLQLGIPGQTAPVSIPIFVNQNAIEVAAAINQAILGAGISGVSTTVADSRIFVEGTLGVDGVGAVDTVTISDEVGNQLQSNQSDGRTELTIFIGGGFDYGDAPAPYASLLIDGGPRNAVDQRFSIGPSITADSDAIQPDADDDDGVQIAASRAGFSTNVSINISNLDGRGYYLSGWFDWDQDNLFETSELVQFADPGSTFTGTRTFVVDVPSTAVVGESYARFRLSEVPLGPTGDAPAGFEAGEIEDHVLVISNNPFQNPNVDTVNTPAQDLRKDVNDSGDVSPLDALQIINALSRSGGVDGSIPLDVLPLPTRLPIYPDVDGSGTVTSLDALLVINELTLLPNVVGNAESLEGEWIAEANAAGFAPVASGVLASGATRLGDSLLDDARQTEADITVDEVQPVDASTGKTSVFDTPESVGLDPIVDVLAEDTSEARETDDTAGILDQVFASF